MNETEQILRTLCVAVSRLYIHPEDTEATMKRDVGPSLSAAHAHLDYIDAMRANEYIEKTDGAAPAAAQIRRPA